MDRLLDFVAVQLHRLQLDGPHALAESAGLVQGYGLGLGLRAQAQTAAVHGGAGVGGGVAKEFGVTALGEVSVEDAFIEVDVGH